MCVCVCERECVCACVSVCMREEHQIAGDNVA